MATLANLARMTTATTGTGTITLGAAVSGFLTFALAGVTDGQTVTYAIADGTQSEIGRGVYTSAGTTLTRSVLKSTNSNNPISMSASAQVFVTAAAEDITEAPTINTSVTVPIVIGGTAASSTLIERSTSGVGTTDAIIWQTGSQVEFGRITSAGAAGGAKLLYGATAAQTMGAAAAINPTVQLYAAGTAASFGFIRETTPGGGGALFVLGSSRSTPHSGSYSAILSGDGVGQLVFVGDTGSNLNIQGASILVSADGNWSTTSAPGKITLNTTKASATNVTLALTIDSKQNVAIGQGSALATSATDGFCYLPSSAGIPTGTPATSYTGSVPCEIDTTNNRLYFYNSGWVPVSPIIGLTRVSTQFDKTLDTTLANVTGLSVSVEAGKTYGFEAVLYTASNVGGGVKFAIAGTATATAIIYEAIVDNAATLAVETRATALATAVGGVTAVTAAYAHITGTITVNAAGTLTVQFAQNASNVAASSVLIGSTFTVTVLV